MLTVSTSIAAALALAGAAVAQQDLPFRLEDLSIGLPEKGAPFAVVGPYAVVEEPAFGSPRHLVYRPATLDATPTSDRLPVVAWGNGACLADGRGFSGYLSTLASYGFLVVGTAPVEDDPQARVSAADLIAALDWAETENAREGSLLQGRIATDAVAVMGMSCGGVLTIEAAGDPRIDAVGIWNSGLFISGEMRAADGALLTAATKDDLARIHTPALFVNGEIDPARINAADDVARLDHVPVFFGVRANAGHAGTYAHANGGEFATVGANWLLWRLKGDETAGAMFAGEDCGLCANPDWEVLSRGFK
jgi:pimeloyl-ACP methyl ester carboxylesterase